MVIDLTTNSEDEEVLGDHRPRKRLRQASIEESLRATTRAGGGGQAAGGPGTKGAQHANQQEPAGTPLRPERRRRRLDDGAGPSQQVSGSAPDPVTPTHQLAPTLAAGSPGPGPSRTTQPAAPLPATRPRAGQAPPPSVGPSAPQVTAQAAAGAEPPGGQTPQGPHGRQGQGQGDTDASTGAGPSTAGPSGAAQSRRPRAASNGPGGVAAAAAAAAAMPDAAAGAAGPAAAAATAEAQRHSTWRALHSQEAELAEHRDALAGTDAGSSVRFLHLANQANSLLQDIHEPAMAAREAAQHHLLTDAALQASTRLERAHGARTPQDLVDAIRVLYAPPPVAAGAGASGAAGGGGGNPYAGGVVDWARLGWDVERLRRPARGPSVMLGPLEVRPKERKAPAARRPRDKVAEVTQAQELQEQDGSGHDSFTSAIMEEMLTALRRVREQATAAAAAAADQAGTATGGGGGGSGRGKGRGAVDVVLSPCGLTVPLGAFRPYREVVLDHAGFAQTMENASGVGHLFTQEALLISFDDSKDAPDNVLLAASTREEMAAVRLARKRGVFTVATGQQARGAGGGGGTSAPAAAAAARNQETSHMLVSYDMGLWRSWCERTLPQACLMRSRPSAQNPDALDTEGWAGGGAAGGAAGGTRGAGAGAGAGGRGGRGHTAAGAGPSQSGGGGRRTPH